MRVHLARLLNKVGIFFLGMFFVFGQVEVLGQIKPDSFVVSGDAIRLSDSCFQLTPESNNKGGSVWYKQRLDLNFDFEVVGKINLGRLDGPGADGIAFVLQPLSNTLGNIGGGLGYQGVNPSLAVEFDTWQNNDPAYDHIALVKNGILDHYISPAYTLLGPFELLPNFGNAEDGLFRTVRFVWNASGKRFMAYYDGVLKIDYTGDIINTIFNGNPFVYWGFTAATGAAINNQQVCLSKYSIVEEFSCPKVTVVSPSPVCKGDTLKFIASAALSYTWTGPNNFSSTSQNPYLPKVDLMASGTYTLVARVNDKCIDTVRVNCTISPPPSVFAGNDTTLLIGRSLLFNPVTSNDVISYLWTPATYLSCTNCLQPRVTPLQSTTYAITVRNDSGCVATDSIAIEVSCADQQYFIPNAFTPNGDGVNDYFYPRGEFINKVNFLRVYNHWGEVVFEQKDFNVNDASKGWDGRYRGKILDSGVFVYMIQLVCFSGNTIDLKGSIMILQ